MISFFKRRRSGATPRSRTSGPAPVAPRVPPAPTARRSAASLSLRAYMAQHARAFSYSLGQLWRARAATLMTAAVIGIALALPTALYLVLEHAQQVSAGWKGGAQVTLLLKQEVSDEAARTLAIRLRAWPALTEVRAISRAEALEEFRRLSGFGAALDALDENPLPAVLVLQLTAGQEDAERLLAKVRALPEVELAEFDEQWLKRLHAIMAVIERAVQLLALLLAAAVLFIVGNTLRLAVQSRSDEIEVSKLIGASDAFIRRPFLYSGMWHGALGGVCAWVMVSLALWLLHGPVQRLAALYQSDFSLSGLGFTLTLWLVAAGAVLGLLGAWLSVGRHLANIEPA
ncbi:MAG: permease-like cell division protein FtsX [Gammaproteobacteria bacterium]|nr:permease-like cell division protein FtsX [Gammaproteobacteria bacterium]